MKTRNADFLDAFETMHDTCGYTKYELLVVVKAYDVFLADKNAGKSRQDCGWLDSDYDIASGVFHEPLRMIFVANLYQKMTEHWEQDNVTGRFRLSEDGLEFIADNPKLIKSAKQLLGGVNHIRRA